MTNAHMASVVTALQRDVSGLTPEMVGDNAMEAAADVLAHIDRLHDLTPHGVAIMLAIIHDNYPTEAREWAKLTYDLADAEELRSTGRLLDLAMYGVKTRHEASEAWKRHRCR